MRYQFSPSGNSAAVERRPRVYTGQMLEQQQHL